MRKSLSYLVLAASIALALAFTFACSSDGGGGGGGEGGDNNGGGNSSIKYGSLTYEGKTYKTVKIGEQTWLAENLNYAVEGSKCYNDSTANCTKYGRLYDWATAMKLNSSCNSSPCASQITTNHRGICPPDWHIPSNADWDVLVNYAGGSSIAGDKLKAARGWNETGLGGNGKDTYGFAALPGGGFLPSEDYFFSSELSGNWWSANEKDYGGYAYYWGMFWGNKEVSNGGERTKEILFSIRCVKD